MLLITYLFCQKLNFFLLPSSSNYSKEKAGISRKKMHSLLFFFFFQSLATSPALPSAKAGQGESCACCQNLAPRKSSTAPLPNSCFLISRRKQRRSISSSAHAISCTEEDSRVFLNQHLVHHFPRAASLPCGKHQHLTAAPTKICLLLSF